MMSTNLKPSKASRKLKSLKMKQNILSKLPNNNNNNENENDIEKIKLLKDSLNYDENLNTNFYYDTDWSNLGEDSNEDTCSENDFDEELFFNAKKKFSSLNKNNNNENDEIYESNDECNDEEFDQEFEDLLGEDENDLEHLSKGARSKKLFNKNIGRIMKPIELNNSDNENLIQSTEKIKKIWNEDDSSNSSNEDEDIPSNYLEKKQHKERLKDMRLKSGVDFASNPKEFLLNGLPKYGRELSDEENDFYSEIFSFSEMKISIKENDPINRKSEYLFEYINEKPSKDTIAYDSEFDCSD